MTEIITSLLDTDWYKLSMGQFIYRNYRNIEVTFGLSNRTKSVHLADFVSERVLRDELDHVRSLRFSNEEIDFLRSQRSSKGQILQNNYLRFLKRDFSLPQYELREVEGQYDFRTTGLWHSSSHWEIYALSIATQLYHRELARRQGKKEELKHFIQGVHALCEKGKRLQEHPDVSFSDFGTRRRYSKKAQEAVVQVMSQKLPRHQFLGTSNVSLAMKLGLPVIGTSAHELQMVVGALNRDIEAPYVSQNRVLYQWWKEFGYDLSIALTDTLGTRYFLEHLPFDIAREWKGFRQDSGDPIAIGEMIVAFYATNKIDPREKLIVFSDGLNVDAMIRIAEHFKGRIRTMFGWGTNLTNDWGFQTLSLVMKAVSVRKKGKLIWTVKLSDNLAKAIGDPKVIAWYKKECGYGETFSQECRS